MDTKGNSPSNIATFTRKWIRRVCVFVLLLLFLITTAARVRSYLMVRKIQAVLHGLSDVRVDQTTEEQLTKSVPYLSKITWFQGSRTTYRFEISTENDPRTLALAAYYLDESAHLADWLGYRYIGFMAIIFVENGRVSHIEYGLANRWTRPQSAAYIGYIVSARSAHAFWSEYNSQSVHVTSVDDYSPEYRPDGNEKGLTVIYTPAAPISLTRHAYDLKLNCFWGLHGCDDARTVAPSIWQDKQQIQEATYQQIISGKCPDSIVEGRMRYLPDISLLLLEVTGSKRIEVNEEGGRTEDWLTDYKLKEVIRGRNSGTWTNVRFGRTIPSPKDPTRTISNQIWPQTKVGTQVLFFGNLNFNSCRLIPATPSALELVRKVPLPEKRSEDNVPFALQ
jgi:hypothetical protein